MQKTTARYARQRRSDARVRDPRYKVRASGARAATV
jgi:hypothetical protein